MRKLASIRKVTKLSPINGADRIEIASIDGWNVVVAKGLYTVDDLVVYFEVDSWIPHDLAPFLTKGTPSEFLGVKGNRLRTIKIRGVLSQGLVMPISTLEPYGLSGVDIVEGKDVTELLGILKWEVVELVMGGEPKGVFPEVIPKTDQERVQNIVDAVDKLSADGTRFEITEKLEGSSMTCHLIKGVFGVCSRNTNWRRDEKNTFWKVAVRDKLEDTMRNISELLGGIDLAIQGELIGFGIQGNIYKLHDHEFHVFDIYDITNSKFLDVETRLTIVNGFGINHVPILSIATPLRDIASGDIVESLIKYADGKSRLADTAREGVVFKAMDAKSSFKVISNKYLLGEP